MLYERFFMPLENEATGYDFKGRIPSGRCVLESRGSSGKLTVRVQDLKPETLYGIYIIFAENGRYAGVGMGSLSVDTKGRGESRRDIDETALNGFKITEALAVAVTATDAPGIISPLCGYRERPFSWRNSFFVLDSAAVTRHELKDKPANEAIEATTETATEEITISPEELAELNAPLKWEDEPAPEEIPEPAAAAEIIPESIPEPAAAAEIIPESIPEPAAVAEIIPESIPEPEPVPEFVPPSEPVIEVEPTKPPRAPKARKPKGAKPTPRRALPQEIGEAIDELNDIG